MTPAQFRKAALALPDVVEGEHQGHPDFRAGGRVFATLLADGARGMVKLPAADQARLVAGNPRAFEPASGAWGRAGSTYVLLAEVAVAVVEDALTLAWQAATAGRPPRRR